MNFAITHTVNLIQTFGMRGSFKT